MKISIFKGISVLTIVLIVVACAATTGVLSKGDGVYTINIYRGNESKVKLLAYQHAERFCAGKNQMMKVVKENLRVDPASPNMGIMDLDFKCEGNLPPKDVKK
jgi:uncharacterized protein involved in tellurium resistance